MNYPAAIDDLRQFLTVLEAQNDLRRIAVEVDADLEIAAITDRVCKGAAGRRALLFERVRGYRAPVATNLFGSPRRAAQALNVQHANDAAGRLTRGLEQVHGKDAETRLHRLLQQPQFAPRRQSRGECHQVVMARPDLSGIPALRNWPGDGGRYLNLPQIYSRHPDGGVANCGMYRCQLLGPRQIAVHWRESSDAARHCRAWHARNLPMPVSIALGGAPAMMFAATFPLPPDIDEAALAGLLCDRPVSLTSSLCSELPVPGAAEYILEGLVHPGETVEEGPFGNHTGFYQPRTRVPLLRVTSVSHRYDPILVTTVVGPPPMENCCLGKLAERLLLPLLRIDYPAIVDIHMPVEGIFHGASLIAVKPGTSGKALLQDLWQIGPLRNSRLLVVATADEIQDPATFFWRTLNRLDAKRDLLVQDGRLGIDATQDPAGLQVLRPDMQIQHLLQQRWAEYGLD